MSSRPNWNVTNISSRRKWRANAPNIAILVLIAAIVAFAITKGVQTGKLTWADLIFIGVLIPSIMFHEVSHGVVALWCGDDTAKRAGRISANPVRHIDPIGTVLVPIAMVLLLHYPSFFGWAKPVPVSLNRLRHPRNQAVLVGLAGPASNGLLALLAGVALHFIMASSSVVAGSLAYSLVFFTTVSGGLMYWLGLVLMFLGIANLFVGAFNLLPIPPLDGASLLERFIPVSALPTYYRVRMGFIVVVLLLVYLDRGFLSTIFGDMETWYFNLVAR
ncbi:MAG: site-2 protease family protein [Acidimicrobiales bacterium]